MAGRLFLRARCYTVKARKTDASLVFLVFIVFWQLGNLAGLIRQIHARHLETRLSTILGLSIFNATHRDAVFFNSTLGVQSLENPELVLGGESDLAPVALLKEFWASTLNNPNYEIVPKLGIGSVEYSRDLRLHFQVSTDGVVGDENPEWTANRLLSYLAEDEGIPSVDLSYLKNKVTLV